LKRKKKPLLHPLNVGLSASQHPLGVGKFTNLDVDQFLNPNQHQLQPHQVDLHRNLKPRTKILKILLNPVTPKAKRKRTFHLILQKPLQRARKRLKLRLKLRKGLLQKRLRNSAPFHKHLQELQLLEVVLVSFCQQLQQVLNVPDHVVGTHHKKKRLQSPLQLLPQEYQVQSKRKSSETAPKPKFLFLIFQHQRLLQNP